jgi:SAM-dependent methyltransferase
MKTLRRRLGEAFFPVNQFLSRRAFKGSEAYWQERYNFGGNSGGGSYGALADYKADFLNSFVKDNSVKSVIEFGCGDGNQLALASYPSYIGLDVARAAIERCMARFADDPNKSFFLYSSRHFVDRHRIFEAELAVSLDVIYHLVEDEIYERYIRHMFSAARRYVVIYSTDDEAPDSANHVRHRRWSPWVLENVPDWRLVSRHTNPLHEMPGGRAEFAVFEKAE